MLADYELTRCLLAADYGVPQRRPRTIVIGSRVGEIALPSRPTRRSRRCGMQAWRTVRDAIGGLPERPATTELPARRPSSSASPSGQSSSGSTSISDAIRRELSLQRYDCIPPGGGRFDLPDELLPRCWRNKPTGTTDVMGRMRWDAPSLTIRTEFFKPEKGQYLHPQWDPDDPRKRVNRVITHLEAALLQEFPETFAWCGSKIEIAKQIGNAVPVGLAAAIASHIRPYIADDRGPS